MQVDLTRTAFATLKRSIDHADQTVGIFKVYPSIVAEGDNLNLFTLELPWKDNQRNISCIPAGYYFCNRVADRKGVPCFNRSVFSN